MPGWYLGGGRRLGKIIPSVSANFLDSKALAMKEQVGAAGRNRGSRVPEIAKLRQLSF